MRMDSLDLMASWVWSRLQPIADGSRSSTYGVVDYTRRTRTHSSAPIWLALGDSGPVRPAPMVSSARVSVSTQRQAWECPQSDSRVTRDYVEAEAFSISSDSIHGSIRRSLDLIACKRAADTVWRVTGWMPPPEGRRYQDQGAVEDHCGKRSDGLPTDLLGGRRTVPHLNVSDDHHRRDQGEACPGQAHPA
jgi:hypothetical protein